ncbi:transporter substrate-binding domain-containing protein [Pseudoalteromonas sp. Of7M-16]|uniref:substrate-binding periplasmic protein n=1 Tax=Pseudoalteromonas sp. Of7M-16 TaxID=2917756 RepID=UPI001EF5A0C0|nr:transporter substrate-binding domain-containing protein [Pseudoalteromonas sp. Of7M-16]MCG7551238.1 transporter substrate-binding domain-containing protein [Pseudoalteromonas sp. Of7M-16]
MMKIKRQTRPLILAILVYFAGCHTSYAQTLTITIGEYPPYSGVQLVEQGLVPQIIRKAFAQQGIKVKFVFMPWARSFKESEKVRYDASAYWFCTTERQRDYLCSTALYEETAVFFYNKNNPIPPWQRLEELDKYRIGATRGYSYTQEFWQLASTGLLNISIMTRDEQNLSMLIKGRIDLFPMGLLPANYLLEQEYPNDKHVLSYHSTPLMTGTLHLLFPRTKPTSEKLLKIFNDGMQKIIHSGEYQTILNSTKTK